MGVLHLGGGVYHWGMVLFFDIVYALAIPLVAPFVAIKSVRTGKYRSGWAGRFGLGGELFPERTGRAKVLLVHCVSVGELLSVQTLVQRLLAADADLLIAITTTTDTGTVRAGVVSGDAWAGASVAVSARFFVCGGGGVRSGSA